MQCWMLVLFSVCLWHSRKETFLLPLADLNNIWSISRLYKKHPPKKRENGCWVKLVRFEIKWVSWSWKVIVQYEIQTGACTCGDFCWHRWLSFAFLWCSVSTAHSMKQRKLTFPKSAGANARCGGLWCDVTTTAVRNVHWSWIVTNTNTEKIQQRTKTFFYSSTFRFVI